MFVVFLWSGNLLNFGHGRQAFMMPPDCRVVMDRHVGDRDKAVRAEGRTKTGNAPVLPCPEIRLWDQICWRNGPGETAPQNVS